MAAASDPGRMWDRRFAEQGWPTEPDPLLVELVTTLPPGRALDLGSGPGRNSLWLAARGWRVTALDASAVGLAMARERAAGLGLALETVQADVLRWSPPVAAFELVVVANLHPGSAELPGVLARAVDALVVGGHLFVVGHDLADLGRHGPPDPDRLFTVDALAAALPGHVAVERLERRERPPDDSADPGASEVAVLAWGRRTAAGPAAAR